MRIKLRQGHQLNRKKLTPKDKKRPSPFKPIYCILCGKISFYRVGETGFCGDHKEEAIAEARRKSAN